MLQREHHDRYRGEVRLQGLQYPQSPAIRIVIIETQHVDLAGLAECVRADVRVHMRDHVAVGQAAGRLAVL